MNRRMMALGLAAAIALPAAASAAETPIQPRIVVTGEGEAAVAPDMALLSLSVMREAKTAREALDANNAAMAAVIAAMKAVRHRRPRPADGRHPDHPALQLHQQAGRHAGRPNSSPIR